MRRNGPLALAFHALFIGFILAPLAMVCLVSFTDKAYLSLPFDGASLRWYLALAEQPEFLRALQLSLLVAAACAHSNASGGTSPQQVTRSRAISGKAASGPGPG